MTSNVRYLVKSEAIRPPTAVHKGLQYEITAGSTLYGMTQDDSDIDVVGWCIPR